MSKPGEGGFGPMSSRANYSGRANREGAGSMFTGDQRIYEREAASRGHTALGGGFGVGFMAPVDQNGAPLGKEQKAVFEMQFGGRMHHLNSKGQLRFVDTGAFQGALEDALEKERRLSQLSTYILGGNNLVANVFGPEVIAHLKPWKEDRDMPCNGITIPKGLAAADAEPDVLRLYDPSMKEWLVGSAKFRAVISTYPIVPIGELPSWNMGTEGAGEKTDVSASGQKGAEAAATASAETLNQQAMDFGKANGLVAKE